jgi:hypothetical protein
VYVLVRYGNAVIWRGKVLASAFSPARSTCTLREVRSISSIGVGVLSTGKERERGQNRNRHFTVSTLPHNYVL